MALKEFLGTMRSRIPPISYAGAGSRIHPMLRSPKRQKRPLRRIILLHPNGCAPTVPIKPIMSHTSGDECARALRRYWDMFSMALLLYVDFLRHFPTLCHRVWAHPAYGSHIGSSFIGELCSH